MFSTGMPLLYVVSAIFYFIFYWVYKVLLMNYYMKTTSFNEDLAIKSVKIMEFGLLLKIIVGSFMISNNAIFGQSLDFKNNMFHSLVEDFMGKDNIRFSSNHSILYIAICIILIIFMICSKIIISFIVFLVESLIMLIQGKG